MPNASHSHADCNWKQNLLFVIKIGFFLKLKYMIQIRRICIFSYLKLQIFDSIGQFYRLFQLYSKITKIDTSSIKTEKKNMCIVHTIEQMFFFYIFIHSVQVFMLLSDRVCTEKNKKQEQNQQKSPENVLGRRAKAIKNPTFTMRYVCIQK